MILRKPYAFIIKHFKLLHLILAAILSVSIYRLNLISSFLEDYLANPIVFNRFNAMSYIDGTNTMELIDRLDSLFPFYSFLLPLIAILLTLVMLFILYSKKKPYLLYIIIILYSILTLAYYGITYNLTSDMQQTLVDTRFANLINDFSTIVIIAGVVITGFVLVRATGFDIKKFNFVRDLQELDITDADNEEFEVELNIDSNIIRRKFRKTLRNIKYAYVERKFLINLIAAAVVVISGFVVYFVVMVHHQDYNQLSSFGSDDFTMHIDNVYLTNKDYSGKQITDKYLVIIDLNVYSSYYRGKALDLSNCKLIVGDKEYKHTSKYRDFIYDIGTVYEDNLIYSRNSEEAKKKDYKSNYLLVYEIPKSMINKNMIFRYTIEFDMFADTLRPKYARVKLNPINLDKDIKTEQFDLTEQISLKDSVIGNSTLLIDSYEINETMAEYYRFCLSTKQCFDSVEYITPTIGDIDKSILKISGKIDNFNILGVYNLYNLIEKFGKLEYRIDNRIKRTNIINKLNPKHATNDTYYIEIPREAQTASNISLKFYIRNKVYEYILKQEITDEPLVEEEVIENE